MPIIGTTSTGRTWPTELEVSRLDAPSQEYVLDPALPILGVDPKFESDQVVVGRGRLIGVKADAAGHTGTNLTTGVAHKSILTIADGVNVAPLGYAKANFVKDWAQKAKGVMPDISRNMMIAVPYINAVNGAYGILKQGDAVTAYNATDPRYKGAIVKYIPQGVYQVTGIGTTAKSTGCPVTLPKPVVLAGVDDTDAAVATSVFTIEAGTGANAGYWQIKLTTGTDHTALLAFGQPAQMKAGTVWGVEGLDDMPGFMQWVKSNFGAWQYPPMFPILGNSAASATYDIDLQTGGYCNLKSGNTTITQRIDAYKAITVKVKSGQTVYAYDEATNEFVAYTAGDVLPKASFEAADNTQGKHYMVDPVNARITFFGIYKDATGTALSEAELEAALSVTCSLESLAPEPAFGTGIYGMTDGEHAAAPLSYTKDPVTGAPAIGILRVAIL